MIRTYFLRNLAVIGVSFVLGSVVTPVAQAQSIDDPNAGVVDVSDQAQPRPSGTPRVGRKAAEKYMGQRGSQTTTTEDSSSSGNRSASSISPNDHYLALHFGGFVSDTAYKWGVRDSQNGTGQSTIGVTYRVGEWRKSMDLGVRIDHTAYSLDAGRANKLSFMPIISFPDASSRFPLYFGAGLGLGVFMNQLSGESPLSLDYQLILGARFFDIAGTNTGFILEAGMKNHILLSSDGQFNGTFIAVGPVFTF